jgi:type IV pilus assembly protein PilA
MNIQTKQKKSGQAMVEYIIIVVVVAIAAIAVLGAFGDRIRAMFGGATEELGGDAGSATAESSVSIMQGL